MIVARLERVGFRYAGADADTLSDLDMELSRGELVLLEGGSGSGKSTLLRVLAGTIPHLHGGRFRGRCVVDGVDTRGAAPAAVAARSTLAFQDPEAQGVMRTVSRDVAFGPECLGRPSERIAADVTWALAAAGAAHLADRALADLSGGERQRAALAGVLAMRTPIVLLDEPTSQLDDRSAAALVDTLVALTATGVCVLVAEHRIERLDDAADRHLVLDAGRLRPATNAARPPRRAAPRDPSGPAALRADGLGLSIAGRVILTDAELALPRASVTVLSGPNGAGKTTLLRVLAGLRSADRGRILLGDDDVTDAPIEDRFPRIAMVAQDPGRHLLCERVDDEVAFALVQLGVPRAERERRTGSALARADLTALAGRHPLDLSVGERERVAIAAILVADPSVLLLDEPTRGMDRRAKERLANHLRALAAEGTTVLVATHDASFADTCGTRRLCIDGGRLRPDPRPARPIATVAA